jgi:hypothetical protein
MTLMPEPLIARVKPLSRSVPAEYPAGNPTTIALPPGLWSFTPERRSAFRARIVDFPATLPLRTSFTPA